MIHHTNMMTSLSHLGLLCVSGQDASRLLQGQLTCNLDEISSHQSRLAAHCNPQGRILSLSRLFYYRDNYYLQMPLDLLSTAYTALQKYAVFFKVELLDVTESLSRISYSGPEATKQLSDLISPLPVTVDETTQFNDLCIIKLPGLFSHYEIIGEPATVSRLIEQLAAHAKPADINIWKYLNITAGIPTIYANTTGKLLPHELNLPQVNGVSFHKGCYTGQEIIARMHYRGKLKKQMYRARVNTQSSPLPGQDIYHNNDPCGTVVDSCQESEDIYQILMVTTQQDMASSQLFLDPTKKEPLECLALPYEL